jgi:hypothetical protein
LQFVSPDAPAEVLPCDLPIFNELNDCVAHAASSRGRDDRTALIA